MITFINAFSPNMLGQSRMTLEFSPITLSEIVHLMEGRAFQSYMGQLNIARIFSDYVNQEVRVNRRPYRIHNNDTVIQVQYLGPFMEEEETSLPEGGRFQYWKITPMELKSEFSDGDNQFLTYARRRG